MSDRGGTAPPDMSLWRMLRRIWALLDRRTRRGTGLCVLLMLVASVAEFLTIGALIPFLSLVTEAEGAMTSRSGRILAALFGSRPLQELILLSAAMLAAMAILSAATRLLVLRYSNALIVAAGHRIGCSLFRNILRQPYSTHVARNPSELLAGLDKVQTLTNGVLIGLVGSAVSAVLALAIVAILLAIEPVAATAVAIVAGGGYVATSRFFRRGLLASSRQMSRAASARMRLLQESIGGIREILLGRSQAEFEARFRRSDLEARTAQARVLFLGQAPRLVAEAVGLVTMGLLALYLTRQSGGFVAAIPVLGAFALSAQRLLPLLQQIYSGWTQFAGAAHVIDDVLNLIEEPVLAAAAPPADAPGRPFARDVRFDGVSFLYPGRAPAVVELSFAIARGRRVGITGPSGSGKSTLLDLMSGLLRPTQGRILIDGRTLEDRDMARWQAQIAFVSQEAYIADRSVAENIAFGVPPDSIDMDAVRSAAGRARIEQFVDTLAEGFATPLGERGVALSGGQRQRIAIARALYRRASFLIFDEATSALDQATEAEIMSSILTLDEDLTIVIVTHRLSSLTHCDMVLRLQEGRLVPAPGLAGARSGAGA